MRSSPKGERLEVTYQRNINLPIFGAKNFSPELPSEKSEWRAKLENNAVPDFRAKGSFFSLLGKNKLRKFCVPEMMNDGGRGESSWKRPLGQKKLTVGA